MKANRRFVNGDDDAVSPVIAVILMVAITVVLAATVYLWVSGFGTEQTSLVQASFAAKAIDMPGAGADTDSSDDALEITYTSGSGDLAATDVKIFFDGKELTWVAASDKYVEGGSFGVNDICTSAPGGATNDQWARGASVFLNKVVTAGADTGVVTDCGSPSEVGNNGDLKGTHLLKVVVRGQVVLDTSIEIHDNGGT